MFCKRDSSYHVVQKGSKTTRSIQEVIGTVTWEDPPSEGEKVYTEIEIACQPERKLPSNQDNQSASAYDQSTDCHPFWHIRRSDCVSEINCEIVWVEIKSNSLTSMTGLKHKENTPHHAVCTFVATVPCIRNTEDIEMGKEVVLKWTKKAEPKNAVGQKRVINPFNQQAPKGKKG